MSEQVLSDAKLAANRENAQKSRGPVTDAGKAAVRLNAFKTGLTGVTVVFPGDDVDLYTQHVLSYETQFEPVGPEESALVQSIADILAVKSCRRSGASHPHDGCRRRHRRESFARRTANTHDPQT